jgi:hypothetical protein
MDLVASRLGGLLDAPPPAVQPARWLWRGLGARAIAIRVGLAALTIGTAAVWFSPSSGTPSRPGPASSAGQGGLEPAAPALLPSPPAPSLAPPTQLAAQDVAPPAEGPLESPENKARARSHGADSSAAVTSARSASRARARRGRSTGEGPHGATQSANTASSEVDRQTRALGSTATAEHAPETQEKTPAHAEVVGPTPDAGVAREVAEAPPVRLPSEVELMLDARRLAGKEPRAAQRLLEQHATRFPSGVLAPEREVLAIEVLRALGQTAEAEQRLQAFRARYPNSMHLRRLSASPTTPAR